MKKENKVIAKIYWTISEVAEMLNENTSALRFWESRLSWFRVKKGRKGHRLYTEEDIDIISKVFFLTRWLGITEAGINKAYNFGYIDRLVIIAQQEQEKELQTKIEK